MLARVKPMVRRVVPHSVYRRYRQRKVASLIANYAPHDVTHTYEGHALRIRLADPLAEAWYDHDWARQTVTTFLRDHEVLAPGATVFDFGAHQAVVALMLAREVGDEGRVIAIEPEPHNARIAAANRGLNNAENLTVIHAAGAAAEGTIPFSEGLNGRVDERGGAGNVEVPAVTVDGLAKEYGLPDLIFMDVEGYEGQVLKGAARTLANGFTSFLVEVHEALTTYGGHAQEIVDSFSGYDRYVAISDDEPLAVLEGSLPAGRFFLVAISPRHRST